MFASTWKTWFSTQKKKPPLKDLVPCVFLNISQFSKEMYLILKKCWNRVFWLFHIFSSPFILAEASHKVWSVTVNPFRPLHFSVDFFVWKSLVNIFFPWKKSHRPVCTGQMNSPPKLLLSGHPPYPWQLLLDLTQDQMGLQRNPVAQLSSLHNGKEFPSVLNMGLGKRQEPLSGPCHFRGHLRYTILESTDGSKQSWSLDGEITSILMWAPKGWCFFSIYFQDGY